jgi:hypothetical protein
VKNNDTKFFRWMVVLIALPLGLAVFGGDRFRYPCQDPANWDSEECKAPVCSVTRTCPEHIFKEPPAPAAAVSSKPMDKGCK